MDFKIKEDTYRLQYSFISKLSLDITKVKWNEECIPLFNEIFKDIDFKEEPIQGLQWIDVEDRKVIHIFLVTDTDVNVILNEYLDKIKIILS